jgi:hypothetical protein
MDAHEARRVADAWVDALLQNPNLGPACTQRSPDEMRQLIRDTVGLDFDLTSADLAQMASYVSTNRAGDANRLAADHPGMVVCCLQQGQ